MYKFNAAPYLCLLSLLIFFVPFFFEYGSNLSDYINLSWLYLIISGVLLIFSILFSFARIEKNVSILDILVTAYVIIALVGNFSLSNDENIILVLYYSVFILFKFSFRKSQDILILPYIIFISAFLFQIFGFLQILNLYKQVDRLSQVSGILREPNIFASFLASILPIAFSMFFDSYRVPKVKLFIKCISITFILLTFFFAIITVSRIAIIVSAIVTLAVTWKYFKMWKKTVFVVCGILIITGFYILAFKIKSDSSYGRILIWKVSSKMISKNPFVGIGYGRFQSEYNIYQSEYFSLQKRKSSEMKVANETYTPFNEFIRILIETGLVGLFLFLAIIFCLFGDTNCKCGQSQTKAIKFTLISIVLIGLVSYPFQEPCFLIIFYSLLGVCSSLSRNKFRLMLRTEYFKTFYFLFFVLCSGLFFYRYTVIKQWLALSKSNILNQSVLDEYAEIYEKLRYNGFFLIDYGERLYANGYVGNSLSIFNEAKFQIPCVSLYMRLGYIYKQEKKVSIAEKFYIQACNMVPNRFRPKFALFILYRDSNQKEKLITLGQKISGMPVKVPSFEIEIMKAQVIKELKLISN